MIQAPFGRFSYVLHPEARDLVFIAGGIGITPLMSNLRHMRDTQADRRVLLLYGQPGGADIVFREELARMEAEGPPELKVVHLLTRAAASWQGNGGVWTGKAATPMWRPAGGSTFFLCCPPPMTKSLVQSLLDWRWMRPAFRMNTFLCRRHRRANPRFALQGFAMEFKQLNLVTALIIGLAVITGWGLACCAVLRGSRKNTGGLKPPDILLPRHRRDAGATSPARATRRVAPTDNALGRAPSPTDLLQFPRQIRGCPKARQAGEMAAEVGHRLAVRGAMVAGRGRQLFQGCGSAGFFNSRRRSGRKKR